MSNIIKKYCHEVSLNDSKKIWVISSVTLILILISTFCFAHKGYQSIDWTFPYFSGAANFERIFDWQISPSDFERASQLSAEEYRAYNHQRTHDLIPYTYNNYGYVLVVFISQTIFPFTGDLEGVIIFQLLVHLAASLFMVLVVLRSPLQRYGFLLFYAANPMIIYFTTFPFYYFWMFLPSLVFAVLVLKPNWRNWWVFLALPLLLFSFLVRQTTVFLTGFFIVVAFYFANTKAERLRAAAAGAFLVLGVGLIAGQSSGSPWHIIYVGLGAYENDFGVPDMGDNRGFEYFHDQTGVNIDTSLIHGNWNDPDVREIYMLTLKERYFEIVKENPWPLFRNAVMNALQVFSVGHIVDRPVLTWLSTALGFLMIAFLIYTRQTIWLIAILASAVGFFLYFPPIPAYNFATYILLTVGTLRGAELLFKRRFDHNVKMAAKC